MFVEFLFPPGKSDLGHGKAGLGFGDAVELPEGTAESGEGDGFVTDMQLSEEEPPEDAAEGEEIPEE